MNRRRLPFSLIFLLFQTLPTLILAINLLDPNHQKTNNNTNILQDVLTEIFERQNWDIERTTTSKLKASKIRFGTAQRYEFRIRFGKMSLIFKFPDELDSWKRCNKENNDFESFVKEIGSNAVLDTFKVDGPFDLWVGGPDHISLSLPLNVSHNSLKRILVGEGITVEVKNAQQLSIFQTFDRRFTVNASVKVNRGKPGFCSFWHQFCTPLLPIHVIGSASLIAYSTRNPDAPVETTLLSKGIIELLPDKCYCDKAYKNQPRLSQSLSLKIERLGKLLRTFLGNKMSQNWFSGFLRSNVKAVSIIRFQLEFEKNANVAVGGDLDDWRTRPTVERVCFQVIAKIEDEKLRPVMVKKVRPFIAVDSALWSNLMSNISFTKFPSILVPPEALTLDVKW